MNDLETPIPPENPTRESTAQYDYAFAGWGPEVKKITKDTTYTVDKIIGVDGAYDSTYGAIYHSTWNYTTSSFTTKTATNAGMNRFRWFAAGYGEILSISSPLRTSHLYFKLAHEFYVPAQAEIQEKLDLIDNLVAKTDINLPTLSSRWDSDFAENVGWVKSEGHWLNGNTYRDAYDLMVSRIGINDKFVAATEGTELTDENANKFLIDTVAVKFRLPLVNGERVLIKKYYEEGTYGHDSYEIYSDGYCEQRYTFYPAASSGTLQFLYPFKNTKYNVAIADSGSINNTDAGGFEQYTGISGEGLKKIDSIRLSIQTSETVTYISLFGYVNIPAISEYNCGNYLFFKLADEVPSTVVNTEQVIADLKQECNDFKATLEEKFNSGAFVTETFRSDDGKSWYRIYSDGWIEQGGTLEETGHTAVITFLVPFTDINWSYYAGGEYYTTSTGTPVIAIVVNTKSITGASFQCRWNGTAAAINSTIPKCTWYACGY